MKNVGDFLIARGYLELPPDEKKGWHDPTTGIGFTTRMRATSKLISLAEDEYDINPYMIGIYPDAEPETIILKSEKKGKAKKSKELDYPDTEQTIQWRDNIAAINKSLASHHIDLNVSDEVLTEIQIFMANKDEKDDKERYIDFTNKRVRRIFNNGVFSEGGRFYGGWWQQIPSGYRMYVTIDDNMTQEMDFSNMNFIVMYAEKGLTPPEGDCYILPGIDASLRDDIKKAFHTIVNCKTRGEAIGAVDKQIEEGDLPEELTGKKLMSAFEEKHEPIADMIASGHGVRGMFTESQIAEKVMLKGIEYGMCILPMHDGFIIRKADEHLLEAWMKQAFLEVTGKAIKVDPEKIKLELIKPVAPDKDYEIVKDGKIITNAPLKDKAESYSQVLSGEDISFNDFWRSGSYNDRLADWNKVHGRLPE